MRQSPVFCQAAPEHQNFFISAPEHQNFFISAPEHRNFFISAPEHQNFFISVLQTFAAVFATGNTDANTSAIPRDVTEHSIPTKPGARVATPQYPLNKTAKQFLHEWILEQLAAGIIEPSNSSWRNPILCTPQRGPDGQIIGYQALIDARKLNEITISVAENHRLPGAD